MIPHPRDPGLRRPAAAALVCVVVLLSAPTTIRACPVTMPGGSGMSTSPSSSGSGGSQSGGPVDPGRGQRQRGGVDAVNASNLGDGSGGGRSSDGGQPSADLTGVIGNVAAAEAKDEAAHGAQCQALRSEISRIQDLYHSARFILDDDTAKVNDATTFVNTARETADKMNKASDAELDHSIAGLQKTTDKYWLATRDTAVEIRLTGHVDPDNNSMVKAAKQRVDQANQQVAADEQKLQQIGSEIDFVRGQLQDCMSSQGDQAAAASTGP